MSLGEQLHGARLVRHDAGSGLTLAWHGGHGVHVYADDGVEVAFWNVGANDMARDADEQDVLDSMRERMEDQDYVDFS